MPADRWRRVEELFEAALALAPERRSDFLDEASEGDPSLREEVRSLLAAHERAGESMASAVAGLAAEWAGEDSTLRQRLGRFRMLSPIGRGGMGEVWLAEDTKLGRKVALKLLPREATGDPERLGRFQREARAASALNHPGILTVHDVDQIDGTHFIATEFVEGRTLRALLAEGPLELARALDITRQIAAALGAAHAAGIVHRDIKPENVMVRPDGLVKVLDFGLAKLSERAGRETSFESTAVGAVVGTARYMSPEQARGIEVDSRSDIFSLGVVVYEMLSGRPPFSGATTSDIIASILTSDPEPLRQVAPGVSEEVESVVHRALQKRREDRYPAIRELERDLDTKRGSAPRQELSTERPALRASRRRLWALALAAIAALAFGLYQWWGAGRPIDSIAILPFENVGQSAGLEHLADGIPEALINRFTGVPHLRVLPRSTVFRHRGETDPVALARGLGVDAVLSGSVSEREGEVSVQVDLIDVEREAQLWGERYGNAAANIPDIQRDIATNVTERLRLALDDTERGRVAKPYTRDPEAYQLFLRGRHLVEKGDPDSQRRGIDYFLQATARDPGFALAFAQIAFAYTYLDAVGEISGNEAGPKAREYVNKALAIDDELAEAHVYLGDIKTLYEWDWPGAEREYQRGLALNPSSGMAHRSYAIYLVAVKRFEEAISEMRRALELEPLSSLFNHEMTAVFYFSRRYDEAIQQGLRAVELDRANFTSYFYLYKAYVQRGRFAEAVAAWVDGVSAGDPRAEALRKAFESSGWTGYLREQLDRYRSAASGGYVSPSLVAELHVQLGEKEEALEWLEKAIADRDDLVGLLAVEPIMDPLRSEPRFQEMLRAVNLPN